MGIKYQKFAGIFSQLISSICLLFKKFIAFTVFRKVGFCLGFTLVFYETVVVQTMFEGEQT